MYQGKGKLIGTENYLNKNGVRQFIYNILVGSIDKQGFYVKPKILNVIQEIELKEIKPNVEVTFDIEVKQFGQKSYEQASNIALAK